MTISTSAADQMRRDASSQLAGYESQIKQSAVAMWRNLQGVQADAAEVFGGIDDAVAGAAAAVTATYAIRSA